MVILENTLNIFTDGSSLGRPRRGGIGVIFVIIDSSGEDQVHKFDFAGYPGARSNEMELQACIVALKEAMKLDLPPNVTRVVIQLDSQYVVGNLNRAKFEWPKTRWLNRHGRPVLNAPLWKELVRCIQKIGMRVEIRWVKGHSKNQYNKAADKLARAAARMPLNIPLTHVNVRRKKTDKSVDVGSVEMNGQRITIRIITSEYLRVQRVWKYKYEVISKGSKYRGNVDFIFSKELSRDRIAKVLRAAHTYYVRVNCDTSNPRIEKVFGEIEPKGKDN